MVNKYTHIEEPERRSIERFLSLGKSTRQIAKALGRSSSSISEEIRKNSIKGRYLARKANHKSYVRRKYSKIQCLKVAENSELREFVEKNIQKDWSPEAVSGRLKEREKDIEYASCKAIYKFVHSVYGRNIEKHLYSKAVRKRGGSKRKRASWKDERISIEKRPKRIEKRTQFGHFEGDFIESGKEGKGSVLVLVERKTRYPFLRYLENYTNESVNDLITGTLSRSFVESVTVDNDIRLQKHKELSVMLGTPVFFCHTQSPHEKGTIENRNKLIRRYIPKRSDLSLFKDKILNIEDKLRNLPMKCLGWKTPLEAWEEEMRKRLQKQKNCALNNAETILQLTNQSVRLEGYA